MAQIEFSRAGHRAVSSEIEKELKALGLRLGLNISVGGGNIAPDNLVIKVTVKSSDPMQAERGARDKFAQYASWFKLEGDDYGAEFSSNGRRFKLVEIAPSRPKYPFTGEDVFTGKRFKFTESIVSAIITGRAVKAAVAQQAVVAASAKRDSDTLANVAMF